MAHIRKPIVGDFVYGGPMRGSGLPVVLREALKAFPRQALHARELEVTHPISGKRIGVVAEPPADINELLVLLRAPSPGELKCSQWSPPTGRCHPSSPRSTPQLPAA